MEMHQIRYFLAVARTGNFTRASEECNISQPSLSRAIKQLEAELGGDLFRRERPAARLTMLGEYMLPPLRQCYESATGARSLAKSIKKREVGSLTMIFSRAVDLAIAAPRLAAVREGFESLQMRIHRGTGNEIADTLKQGDADFAVTPSLGDAWDRLDCWPLFSEPFLLVTSLNHRFANRTAVTLEELRNERLVLRPHCDSTNEVLSVFQDRRIAIETSDEIDSDDDLVKLLCVGAGAAVVPKSLMDHGRLNRVPIVDLDVRRTVFLYSVAGRQRTAPATAMMNLLRSADWSQIAVDRPEFEKADEMFVSAGKAETAVSMRP